MRWLIFVLLLSVNALAETVPVAMPSLAPKQQLPTENPSAKTADIPAPADAFFYYCRKTNSYFPDVKACEGGWIAIPVHKPMPLYPNGETEEQYIHETVTARPNGVHLEIFGRASYYSIDYDRALTKHLTLGIGFSSWSAHNWWRDYNAKITVVPLYANWYFSENPGRAFVTAGIDWISVTQAGFNDDNFANNGFAGTAGGGYEYRTHYGLVVQLEAFVLFGRNVSINPAFSLGYAF